MTAYFLNRTSGNDGLSGTSQANAWQNISKIASGLVAGDVVNLNRGDIWQRPATLALVGGVTYQPYGTGADPIIEGADLWAGAWVLDSGSIYKQTGVTTVDSASGLLWEDGVKGVRQTTKAAITGVGMYFLDDAADTLYYWSRTGAGGDPTGRRINLANNNSPFQFNNGNGSLSHIVFRYAAGTVVAGGAANMANGWVIDNCRFSGGRIHGVSQFVAAAGVSATFSNCEFDNNGQDGLLWIVGTNNMLVTDCSAHDNTVTGIILDGNTTPSNNVIQRCQAYNNGQDGIVINVNGRSGDRIFQCIAHDNGQNTNDRTGIKSFGQDTEISYCFSYNNNLSFVLGCGFQTDLGAKRCIFHHNVAYGNRNAGFSMSDDGHQLYHNVSANNKKGALEIYQVGGNTSNNLKVKNNLFVHNGNSGDTDDFQGRFVVSDDNGLFATATGLDFDYNTYVGYNGAQAVQFKWGATSYATFAAYRAGVPAQDVHSNIVDPQFVSEVTPDYHLQATSPAIDAGIAITGINDGYNGTAPDKGAFETASTSHGTANSPSNGVRRHRRWYGLYARMLD